MTDLVETIVTTDSLLPLEEGDLTVTLRNAVLLAAGEYAREGSPDVLIHVVSAMDDEGNDIRREVARRLSRPLASALLEYQSEVLR